MTHVLSAVAWPYANGPRHIGHVAGFGVPSDVFSRYMRMTGHDVLMVSGTDEHGTPILVAADKQGVTARDLADKNNAIIVQDLVDLGLSYDLFTRTTTGNHYLVVQELFETCTATATWSSRRRRRAISPSTGRTLPDRYIEGTCPICGYADARGDQCDNCGNQLDPTDLINPRSKINGETPEFVETQHFFLDLPALAEALGEWLDEREASGTWRPNVIKFSKNLVEDLRPRAMTRDIDWGIPVPLDGWRDQPKRLYVWFDAVIGYLSASIEWARRRPWSTGATASAGATGGTTPTRWPTTSWARTTSSSTASSGRPSCWRTTDAAPAAASPGGTATSTCRPRWSPASSSRWATSSSPRVAGIVLYVGDFLARYGPDALRYFICAAGPETSDAAFTWADFVTRNNSELVAGWGNLVNRTATMVAKSFGEIPAAGALEPVDEAVLAAVRAGFDSVGDLLGRHRLRAATAEALRVVGEVNKYLTVTEPYKMKDESQRERLATVLHVAAQCVLDCNTLLAPILPHASNKVWTTFGGEGEFMPMPRTEHVEDLDPGHGAGLLRLSR